MHMALPKSSHFFCTRHLFQLNTEAHWSRQSFLLRKASGAPITLRSFDASTVAWAHGHLSAFMQSYFLFPFSSYARCVSERARGIKTRFLQGYQDTVFESRMHTLFVSLSLLFLLRDCLKLYGRVAKNSYKQEAFLKWTANVTWRSDRHLFEFVYK